MKDLLLILSIVCAVISIFAYAVLLTVDGSTAADKSKGPMIPVLVTFTIATIVLLVASVVVAVVGVLV